jgi:hypothetical protein
MAYDRHPVTGFFDFATQDGCTWSALTYQALVASIPSFLQDAIGHIHFGSAQIAERCHRIWCRKPLEG